MSSPLIVIPRGGGGKGLCEDCLDDVVCQNKYLHCVQTIRKTSKSGGKAKFAKINHSINSRGVLGNDPGNVNPLFSIFLIIEAS